MNESGLLLRRPVAEACMHTVARQKIAQDGALNLFLMLISSCCQRVCSLRCQWYALCMGLVNKYYLMSWQSVRRAGQTGSLSSVSTQSKKRDVGFCQKSKSGLVEK